MNKKIIIGVFLVLILVLVLVFLLKTPLLKTPQEVIITTDQTEYASGEAPVMTIKNNLTSNICLSSCYPYYLEKNNGEWKNYLYEKCEEPDLVEICIESNQVKGLELIVPALQAGLHKIVVPSCLNCQIGQPFKEDQRFYSNEFTIGR